MSILGKELRKLAHSYVRRGAKANRRQQLGRMIKFLEFVEENEHPHNLYEIGARHVLNFWKANRSMAPKTAYGYWLALCELWQLAQKSGIPPKPHHFVQIKPVLPESILDQQAISVTSPDLPSLKDIARNLKTSRLSKDLTEVELATETAIDVSIIQAIEAGNTTCRYCDVSKLYTFLASFIAA